MGNDARNRIADAIDAIRAPDETSRERARDLQAQLTKPAGSLGRLEELHIWAAGVFREPAPTLAARTVVVAAGDHGVVDRGVSAYPSDVTRQMLANFAAGGAAINAIASQARASVLLVDAGVRGATPAGAHVAKLREGTDDMTRGPAMRRDEAESLIAAGIDFAFDCCGAGHAAVCLGDMGIGNTTAAAAVTAAMSCAAPALVTGRGTGIDDDVYAAKLAAVERALAINAPDPADPIDVLAKVGGFEIAFLAGVCLGAAVRRAAVLLDGYPTTAAALVAGAMAPVVLDYMLASHLSVEPGHRLALSHLGLRPLLELEMRLGEGTGAGLALMLLEAALRVPREMATFDSAGVARSAREQRPEA